MMNSNGPQFESFERMKNWIKHDLLRPLDDDQAIQGITGSTTLTNMYAIPLKFANSTLPSQAIAIPARAAHLAQAVDIVIGLDLIILHKINLDPAQSKTTITEYVVPFQERFTDRTPIEITSVPLDGCHGQQLQITLPLACRVPTELPPLTYMVDSQSPQSSPQMPTAPPRPKPKSALPTRLPKRKQVMPITKASNGIGRRNNPRPTCIHTSRNRPVIPENRTFATNQNFTTRDFTQHRPRRPPAVAHVLHTRPKPKQKNLPINKQNESLHQSVYITRARMNTLKCTTLALILAITAIILLGLYKLQLTIQITW